MKDFFKKHPELLYLLIGVIIIDCVMMYVWMGDRSATEASGKKIDQIRNQATEINESSLAITEKNATKALEEKNKWQSAYVKSYKEESSKYKLKTLHEPSMIDAKAKKVLKDKVNYLIDELLQDKDATANRLSFAEYDGNLLFSLKTEEVERTFEILSALEELVKICVEADVITIDKIGRPSSLEYALDSVLGTKSYRFELNATVSAEGVKRLMNKIVSNKNFYFEINGFSLASEEQINVTSDDITPKVQRAAKAVKEQRGIESELDQIAIGLETSIKKDDGGVKTQSESIAPFTDAVIKLELMIDWIQFAEGVK